MNKDLESLYNYLGEVKVSIVSEITKMNEKVEFATLPFTYENPKGEFVIIIEQKEELKKQISDDKLIKEMKTLLKTEDKKIVFKVLQEKYNLTKSYIYNLYEKNKD